MFIRLLFWFVVFYVSFKFLIRVVLPLVITARTVRTKMKDVSESMGGYETNHQTMNGNTEPAYDKDAKPVSKDDYIDFEEIK